MDRQRCAVLLRASAMCPLYEAQPWTDMNMRPLWQRISCFDGSVSLKMVLRPDAGPPFDSSHWDRPNSSGPGTWPKSRPTTYTGGRLPWRYGRLVRQLACCQWHPTASTPVVWSIMSGPYAVTHALSRPAPSVFATRRGLARAESLALL